jgi:hypothetical protein
MDPAVAQRIVDALDAELLRRRERRDREEEARWREEHPDDPVFFGRHYLDRLVDRIGAKSAAEAADIVLALAGDDAGREEMERVERLAEWIVGMAEIIARMERLRAVEAAEAAGIVQRRFKPKLRVRSVGLRSASVGPRPDPAAPKPAERTGRRGAPLVQPGTPDGDRVWLRGMVSHWNPRTWEGAVRAANGTEYRLAVGVLVRSGLTTLIVGQNCEFRVVGTEADWVKAAWH